MNKKKLWSIIMFVDVIMLFTSLVFLVIGCNSDTLVSEMFKNIDVIIFVLTIIILSVSGFVIVKNRFLRGFKKIINILGVLCASLYAIGCTGFLILLYGPNEEFKTWLITTAMTTMNHQYLCKWFYNSSAIQKVMSENTIIEVDEDTDTSLVDFTPTTEYENDDVKELLEHEEGELFKVIQFKVNDCNAYLAAVYDPSKVSVGVSRKLDRPAGQYSYTMAREQNAVLAINGGGFIDVNYNSKGGQPVGVTIAAGKVISDLKIGGSFGLIGFNKDNTLVLMKKVNAAQALEAGVRDAVTMGPFLIVNDKPSFIRGNGGWGPAARTAIGQRKDGVVLFLVVDSSEFRRKGATMVDLTEIMQKYGAVNAANLDGGTSSTMVVNGELINDPIDSTFAHKTRGIPTIFKVVE